MKIKSVCNKMVLSKVEIDTPPKFLREKLSARPGGTKLVSELSEEEQGLQERFKFVRERVADLPTKFDGRKRWAAYLGPVLDQGRCGSSWAWAASSTLGDRIALRSLGKLTPFLSPKPLLACSDPKGPQSGNTGCRVATLLDAFIYLYLHGSVSRKCVGFYRNGQLPSCASLLGDSRDICGSGTPARAYRALAPCVVAGTSPQGGDEIVIRTDIYINGPVASAFSLYPDFYTFDSRTQIYRWSGDGEATGAHSIKLVGWGEDNGEKYWIALNSWGKSWGRAGYFYIARGTNECGVEANTYSCIPDLFYGIDLVLPKSIQMYVAMVPWDLQLKRLNIDFGKDCLAGGVDPTSGFSRRALYTYTGYQFERPMPESGTNELMNIENFTAAKVEHLLAEGYEPTCLDSRISIYIVVFVIIAVALYGCSLAIS